MTVARSGQVLNAIALAEWLFHGPARLPSGAYLSWVSTNRSGFVYPEAAATAVRTAFWLNRTGGFDVSLDRLVPTLSFLKQSVLSDGMVRHRGVGYLFDTTLVYAALCDSRNVGLGCGWTSLLDVVRKRVRSMFESRVAVVGECQQRWSTIFGPHLLKAVALFAAAERTVPLPRSLKRVVESLLLYQDDDGAFRDGLAAATYLHAHCYALEGLAMLKALGEPGLDEPLERGMVFLERNRREDGFGQWAGKVVGPKGRFGQWEDGRGAPAAEPLIRPPEEGGVAGDVTAQAGRLALLVEPESRVGLLAELDGALGRLIGPGGGIRYLSCLDHENTWCTAFALQYAAAREGARLEATDLV